MKPSVHRLVPTADGTRISATLHGPGLPAVPLLCLPGLTRNSRDFEPVVALLAGLRPVLTVDFRGRGLSDSAADPQSYRPAIELADTIEVLKSFHIERVALLGTSRGGIVGMLMAALHPQVIAGLLLNDIAPRIDAKGLLRIMAYVGKDTAFGTWDQAAQAYAAAAPGFKGVSEAQWSAATKRAYVQRGDGKIVPQYDLRLGETLPKPEEVGGGKLPELWDLLNALTGKPVTCLRGAGSDLLSEATLAQLRNVLPLAETVTVPDRGHVPFLDEAESVAAMQRWLERVDQT